MFKTVIGILPLLIAAVGPGMSVALFTSLTGERIITAYTEVHYVPWTGPTAAGFPRASTEP